MQRITLGGYAQVRDAYRSHELEQALYDAGGVVMADSLLVLHGDAHRRRRRVENRLFRPGVFRRWEHTVVAGGVRDALAPCRAAGRADLIELGYRAMTVLTARIAGIDAAGTDGDTLWRLARTFSAGATLVHSTRDPADVRAEVAAALAEFDERFLAPSATRRRALLDAGEPPADVLTALLSHRAELGLTDDVIRRECAFYLQAGSHSSVDAFAHAADDVLATPGLADRARRDPELLQRCVHESLRLHPASPVALRRAAVAVTLRDGTLLPAGAEVTLDVAAANRDPAVFDRPDVHDPDRALPDGVPRWGHAFGGGMHACIGTELAGGVPPRPGERVPGTVTALLGALLDAGGRPDPDDPPLRDPHSARDHFARYPVLLTPAPPDPAPPDSAQPGLAQPGAAQSDPAQSDPAQSDPAQSDPAQSDPAQSDPAQSGTAPPEPAPPVPAPSTPDPAAPDPAGGRR